MMSIKLKHSNFDETSGVSMTTIVTPYGEFTGVARLNPEDKPSSFLGCAIAEKRAIIQAYKVKRKELITMKKAIKIAITDLEKVKNYNKHSVENRRLRKMFYIYSKQIAHIDEIISNTEKSIVIEIEARELLLKRFAK